MRIGSSMSVRRPGEKGGEILYSGPLAGLAKVDGFADAAASFWQSRHRSPRTPREPRGWLHLSGVTRNNLHDARRRLSARRFHDGDRRFRLGKIEPGQPGAGGTGREASRARGAARMRRKARNWSAPTVVTEGGEITSGMEAIKRLVRVDQKAIGRTPRSNLATYTGLFDHVRRLFAATKAARSAPLRRRPLLLQRGQRPLRDVRGRRLRLRRTALPARASMRPARPATARATTRKTLEIKYRDKNIAEVLGLTVDAAAEFFADEPHLARSLDVLRQVGLGYLRLGQPATELSGGEAQRIKLATELQRTSRGSTLYILDEPTTGLHPVRRGEADDATRRPGRSGQHGHRRRARHARRRRERLDHRHGSGRRRRRRPHRRRRAARAKWPKLAAAAPRLISPAAKL